MQTKLIILIGPCIFQREYFAEIWKKNVDFSYKKKIGFLFRVKRNIFLLEGKHNHLPLNVNWSFPKKTQTWLFKKEGFRIINWFNSSFID
jgi:hypothetical protein